MKFEKNYILLTEEEYLKIEDRYFKFNYNYFYPFLEKGELNYFEFIEVVNNETLRSMCIYTTEELERQVKNSDRKKLEKGKKEIIQEEDKRQQILAKKDLFDEFDKEELTLEEVLKELDKKLRQDD